jgi:hypothetical protein
MFSKEIRSTEMQVRVSTKVVRILSGLLLLALLLNGSALVALADSGAQPPTLMGTPIGGTVTGSAAGAFANYVVNYPGNSLDLRIQVVFGPHDPNYNPGLGFNVYGPNGFQNPGIYIDSPNTTLELSFAQADPAQLYVQIYNYEEGMSVSYSVVAKGLPAAQPVQAAAAPASAATYTPMAAVAASQAPSSASGTLIGNTAGAFGKLGVPSTGDGTQATATLTFSPDDYAFWGQIGFQVYDPNGNVVAVGATTDTPGVRQAAFSLSVAGQYEVQIFDYAAGTTMNYTLNVAR